MVTEQLQSEIREYKKACNTLKTILSLFEKSKFKGGDMPEIYVTRHGSLPSTYIFSVHNILIGHVEVESVFDISSYHLNVHHLVSDKSAHETIRRDLCHFLSVYHGEKYELLEPF